MTLLKSKSHHVACLLSVSLNLTSLLTSYKSNYIVMCLLWLIALRIMSSGFIPVAAWVRVSFLSEAGCALHI